MNAVTHLTLQLLGQFRLSRGGGVEVASLGRKAQALVAYLALNPSQPCTREYLATLLWGDRPEEQARQSLRQTLLEVRRALADADKSILVSDGDLVAFGQGSIEVDVPAFDQLAAGQTREAAEQALALYAGDLLDGLNVRSEGFDDWLRSERARIHGLAADTMERLVTHYAEAGDGKTAIETAQRLLALDPVREEAHRMLMRLHHQHGSRTAALKQYQICEEILRRELDIEPEAETVRLHAEVRSGSADVGALDGAAAPEAGSLAATTPGPEAPSSLARPTPPYAGAAKIQANSSMAKRWLWVAAALAAVLIVIGVGYRSYFSGPEEAAPRLSLPDRPSIAVLPFENESGDAEQEYFSNGVTEDIITELSRYGDLFVTARNSAFAYQGKAANVRDVGQELGVKYVLMGSVRRSRDRVRISARLVEAATSQQLWAERFDRDMNDIFALQDEVTRKIVAALAIEVSAEELKRVLREDTANFEAYDYVLRGRDYVFRVTKEDNAKGRELYQKAIALDPNYERAHAYLAWTHVNDWRLGWSDSREQSLGRAFEVARKAVALDNTGTYARAVLGEIYLWTRQPARAIAEIETALALNPNDADSWALLGDALTFSGRAEEAIGHVEEAMRLNPRFPFIYEWRLGHAYFVVGRHEEAIAALVALRDRNPAFLAAHLYLAASYAELGRAEEARAAFAEAAKLIPILSDDILRERIPYSDTEDMARLLTALHQAGLPEGPQGSN